MSTTKKDKVFNPNDYVPKRFGLNYNPPQIIIEYLTPSSGKLYHHKMRLHKFTKEKNTNEVLKELIDRHTLYLSKNKINTNQLIKLIEKLKANLKTKSKQKDDKENSKEQELKQPTEKVEKVEEKKEEPKEEKKEEEEEEEEYNFDEFNDEDLNKLDDDALNEKKLQMDKLYEKNSVKVGDENFQYDVRKDFNHDDYAAEWDDDSY